MAHSDRQQPLQRTAALSLIPSLLAVKTKYQQLQLTTRDGSTQVLFVSRVLRTMRDPNVPVRRQPCTDRN